MTKDIPFASSGHKMGQIIGDWYEEYVVLPILAYVAAKLKLYLDSRFIERECGDKKVIWEDIDGNAVDYDFVMELGGTSSHRGVPVAFFETFWRRGARHSKDKARDDTGKLLPMKHTFPTARVLCVAAAGDFTAPAREYVQSRGVELFYIPKSQILRAWAENGLIIDYPDKATEAEKTQIVSNIAETLREKPEIKQKTADSLFTIVGKNTMMSFERLLLSKLGAAPQEYKIIIQQQSDPLSFMTYQEVDVFLRQSIKYPKLPHRSFIYEVVFGNGDSFLRDSLSLSELRRYHDELKQLIVHVEKLA